MGKVIMSGIVPTLSAPVNYNANFADNTWEQIIDACQKNKVPDTWLVGNQKTMDINGTDYAIDIIGKNHDDYADGSGKAPLTFQMHYVYSTTYYMNNSDPKYGNNGGWTECKMRTTYLPNILSLMSSDVQNGIKEVNKTTSAGGTSSTISTTADKLFLLSEREIYGTSYNSYSGEGSQYAYYAAGNSKAKTNVSGTTIHSWWLRSPYASDTAYFCYMQYSGTYGYSSANNTAGVSFAFCF